MNDKERCENCRFWADFGEKRRKLEFQLEEQYGTCYRYPPLACISDEQHGRPVTNFTDWCGEWQSGEEATT